MGSKKTVEELARITIEGTNLKNGHLFKYQMLLNIGINKQKTGLTNQKENLTKKIKPIMSISHFMRKNFGFLWKLHPNVHPNDDDNDDDDDDDNDDGDDY